jgi:hypothetical protein
MTDKKEQKSQQKKEDLKNVFEIRTMEKDNELMTHSTLEEKGNAKKSHPDLAKKMKEKNNPFTASVQKDQPAANPFLDQEVQADEKMRSSFAPQKRMEPTEKINMSPADIAPKQDSPQSPKKQKNITRVMLIVFVSIFIFAGIGFLIYLFVYQKTNTPTQQQEIEVIVPDEGGDVAIPEISEEPTQQTYVTDWPNYFQLDIESETAETDVIEAMDTIATNMKREEIVGPISFVITDLNNNPVSFPIFALATGIDMPNDILSNLEESFELYAYMDRVYGVRFGFVIDVKNIALLQEVLKEQENQLPKAFEMLLGDVNTDLQTVAFNDSTYSTYPIRYVNLNEQQSYSIDYTVHNLRLFIGTTKDTLRAIIESVRNGVYESEATLPITTESDDDTTVITDDNTSHTNSILIDDEDEI